MEPDGSAGGSINFISNRTSHEYNRNGMEDKTWECRIDAQPWAFDNVSYARLLHILRWKGIPEYLVRMVASFLTARQTRINFTGYTSNDIPMNAGIPQGSALSPILFRFFISELLERFDLVENGAFSYGFVNDTMLITWGESARSNCARLTTLHEQCISWAHRHGAKFAPEKYQITHFTRRRKHPHHDLALTVRVRSQDVHIQQQSMRVLGVWGDPRLRWREHTKRDNQRATRQLEAMSCIAISVWGPSTRKTRLHYTVTVCPTMLYGAQEGSVAGRVGRPAAKSLLTPFLRTQNACLQNITGGYKRTPVALLERESCVPPLDLQVEYLSLLHASRTKNHPVEQDISRVLDGVRQSATARQRSNRRPASSCEKARSKAEELVQPRNEERRDAPSTIQGQLRDWRDNEWKQQWMSHLRNRNLARAATAWKTPWGIPPWKLYEGLSKAEATILFLMRTQVIRLNGWLSSINVPHVIPACTCGWRAQNIRHILLHCPQTTHHRLVALTRTEDIDPMLSCAETAHIAAKWFLQEGILEQFRLTRELTGEDFSRYSRLESVER